MDKSKDGFVLGKDKVMVAKLSLVRLWLGLGGQRLITFGNITLCEIDDCKNQATEYIQTNVEGKGAFFVCSNCLKGIVQDARNMRIKARERAEHGMTEARCICTDFLNCNPDPVSNPDCPIHGAGFADG